MAKVLTDKEMLDIVHRTIVGDEIDCADWYEYFLKDLGELIAKYFGGVREVTGYAKGVLEDWVTSFNINECVPSDGGVFAKYDQKVTWRDGREISGDNSTAECRVPNSEVAVFESCSPLQQARKVFYDRISMMLTDYEHSDHNDPNVNWEGEFYQLLCAIQSQWESIITARDD